MSELNVPQQKLLDCYAELTQLLSDHQGELAPFEERNALKAVAALWQVANGLDQDPGQIYQLGA